MQKLSMAGTLAHSTLSRQLILSTGLVDGSLAKCHIWGISCGLSFRCNSSLPSRSLSFACNSTARRMPGQASTSTAEVIAGSKNNPHFGRSSTSNSLHLAMRIGQNSTVAARAASGSKVGASVGSANKNREIMVQHLLLKEDQIQFLIELQRRLSQDGIDLSDLAEEYSECPSKAQGGMLGWIRRGQTDPAFEEAAFGAPLNKLVRVKTKHGLHLLQVLNEREARFLEQLPVEQFHERMQDPSFLESAQLIDVREPNEISMAAIDGFKAYPLSQFGQWAPNITEDLNPDKETYVLCHHGVRSMQAASWLQSQGFSKLYNIVGGIHAYSSKVDSSVPTY